MSSRARGDSRATSSSASSTARYSRSRRASSRAHREPPGLPGARPVASRSSRAALEQREELVKLREERVEFFARQVDATPREPPPALLVDVLANVEAPAAVALEDPHDEPSSRRSPKRFELANNDDLRSRAAGRPIRGGGHQA